jgi:hypothetical protein
VGDPPRQCPSHSVMRTQIFPLVPDGSLYPDSKRDAKVLLEFDHLEVTRRVRAIVMPHDAIAELRIVSVQSETARLVFKFDSHSLFGVAGVLIGDAVGVGRSETAIRAIQQLLADAPSLVFEAVGIKDREYRRYLQTYRSERDLLNVIEKAQIDDTPLLRFVRAALSVIHETNISGPRRRGRVSRWIQSLSPSI